MEGVVIKRGKKKVLGRTNTAPRRCMSFIPIFVPAAGRAAAGFGKADGGYSLRIHPQSSREKLVPNRSLYCMSYVMGYSDSEMCIIKLM